MARPARTLLRLRAYLGVATRASRLGDEEGVRRAVAGAHRAWRERPWNLEELPQRRGIYERLRERLRETELPLLEVRAFPLAPPPVPEGEAPPSPPWPRWWQFEALEGTPVWVYDGDGNDLLPEVYDEPQRVEALRVRDPEGELVEELQAGAAREDSWQGLFAWARSVWDVYPSDWTPLLVGRGRRPR